MLKGRDLIVLPVLFLMLWFAATASAQMDVPCSQYILPNGLHLILHEDHTLPLVSLNLWYHVGSAREQPGRTGLAHLFEHLMFEGSAHVPLGRFDQWLEAAGGDNNASTTNDRTNYFENVPKSAIELPLFLESDRMAYLIDSMTPAKVDVQREVVKNERRQSYDNQPYGMAPIIIDETLFPKDFPYHWPVIGSMEDLTAASYSDIVGFFRKYYTPANASLVIAGDIDTGNTRALVEKWFRDVPGGKIIPDTTFVVPLLTENRRVIKEDKVQLPRLYLAWIAPKQFSPGNAELNLASFILAGGKNSRLYKRLVYELQIAQDVTAFQDEREICSEFYVIATARSGHALTELERIIRQEIDTLGQIPPADREVQRAVNQIQVDFLDQLESTAQKADQINEYFVLTGNPDYFNQDLERYKTAKAPAISNVVRQFLGQAKGVTLSIVPEGRTDLAAQKDLKRD